MRSALCHTFLHAKGQRPADIHKEIVSVYGNVMNRQYVTKLCRHSLKSVKRRSHHEVAADVKYKFSPTFDEEEN
ncbi:hypothetical protein TNCT_450381 [Trichonephila clavata]|uniref:Mos1 transposase HTH domain-containing protein n=1 Tax=Trichonephila clavata TaxID=2740835 RepID=A0A8X6G8C5_TRICU|nr:hypothetical protein TNCT_450381 [Trichonephila clavata]